MILVRWTCLKGTCITSERNLQWTDITSERNVQGTDITNYNSMSGWTYTRKKINLFRIVSKNFNRIYVMECNKSFCGLGDFIALWYTLHIQNNSCIQQVSIRKDRVFKFHQSILHIQLCKLGSGNRNFLCWVNWKPRKWYSM